MQSEGTTMRKSNEPIWWTPFGGGMMIDALAAPALIVITGILLPLGIVSPDSVLTAIDHPLSRLALFVIISCTFFHAAHRLRFVLADLGLRPLAPALPYLFYGAAIVGTVWTAAVALRLV